jgi:hypothetical protein
MLRPLPVGVFVVALILPSTAFATTIDFESLSDSEVVTNQFTGVIFSNATALTAGVSLNEFEFPPRSGSNVVFDDGGAMSMTFASPLASFGGYFTYLTQLSLEAFTPAHVSLGTITSAFSSSLALSGDSGSSPNEFLQLAFAAGIGSITITGDVAGGSFTLDDAILTPLQAGPDPNAVPEPGTLALVFSGVSGVLARARSSRRRVIVPRRG